MSTRPDGTIAKPLALEPREEDPFHIVGTIVDGRYLVERVVGRGGFAIVYRARHLRFDSAVALKVLSHSLGRDRGRQEVFAQHLLAEGKLLFDLAPLHWSFVRVFEMGTLTTRDGLVAPYLALEWLEGATLREEARRLRRNGQRLGIAEVISLFDGVARGLAIAHHQRIAHRDIKPANIFLSNREGRLKPRILDFGLAKAMSRDPIGADEFGDSHFAKTAFTPAYGAPEQWQRRLGATGTWTDVHALALLCVELLAGAPPLQGDDSASLMTACLDAQHRPTPRAMGVDVSSAVEAVFARAVSIDPRDRYRDAGAFWKSLCRAANISNAEDLPRLTLPLLGGSSKPSQLVSDADDQPTATSTAELFALAASPAPWLGGWLRTGRSKTALIGLALSAAVFTTLASSNSAPAQPPEKAPSASLVRSEPLVRPAPAPSILAESQVSQPPVRSASGTPWPVPLGSTLRKVERSRRTAVRAATRPAAPPFAEAKVVEAPPKATPPRVESSGAFPSLPSASTPGSQLDQLMLDGALTRRK